MDRMTKSVVDAGILGEMASQSPCQPSDTALLEAPPVIGPGMPAGGALQRPDQRIVITAIAAEQRQARLQEIVDEGSGIALEVVAGADRVVVHAAGDVVGVVG